MIERAFYRTLCREQLSQKPMLFLSGPRQTGKTTLVRDLLGQDYPNKVYFNWDLIGNKKVLIEDPAFFQSLNRKDGSRPLVIFDEIHKYKKYKEYLKGVYDEFAPDYHFIVSGSGRLDMTQRGGESLAGRYLSLHLFPFTLAELSDHRPQQKDFLRSPLKVGSHDDEPRTRQMWDRLASVSGFPEPFVQSKPKFWRKWSQTYERQIIREDMRSLHDIRKVDDIEILFSLLSSRVGSPVSMNNLARDLQVSFDSVKQWLSLFDHFYLTFRLSPWSKKITRSLLKEKKLYLYNYPRISDNAARFENMVAVELFRAVTLWTEQGLGNFELQYLRNKDGREVDFVIVRDREPLLMVEAKAADDQLHDNIGCFQRVLKIPAVQLVDRDGVFKRVKKDGQETLIITAHRWLAGIPGQ